jgi:acetyltransferase-like isoleucine patch superfamily enzyme
MLTKIIELAYFKIKGRKIHIDKNIPSIYLIRLFIINFFALIRGSLLGFKYVGIGKRSRILGRSSCYINQGSTIGRSCLLDGVGNEGLFIGHGSSIGDNCILKVSGTLKSLGSFIKIGSGVGLGEFAHLGGAGGLTIGNNTIIGPYFSCHPENHIFMDKTELIKDQEVERVGIKIGSGCWIGAKVTILDGANIGSGCIIAAGAVVLGNFPANSVIGGIPAKVIKGRFDE